MSSTGAAATIAGAEKSLDPPEILLFCSIAGCSSSRLLLSRTVGHSLLGTIVDVAWITHLAKRHTSVRVGNVMQSAVHRRVCYRIKTGS